MGQQAPGYWNELELENLQLLLLVLPGFAQDLLPLISQHHHRKQLLVQRERDLEKEKSLGFYLQNPGQKLDHHICQQFCTELEPHRSCWHLWFSVNTKCTQVPLTASNLPKYQWLQRKMGRGRPQESHPAAPAAAHLPDGLTAVRQVLRLFLLCFVLQRVNSSGKRQAAHPRKDQTFLT